MLGAIPSRTPAFVMARIAALMLCHAIRWDSCRTARGSTHETAFEGVMARSPRSAGSQRTRHRIGPPEATRKSGVGVQDAYYMAILK